MRRVTPGITKPVSPKPYGARAATVTTSDGMVLKADDTYRVGDPIYGPDGKVHWVERVIVRHADTKDTIAEVIPLW